MYEEGEEEEIPKKIDILPDEPEDSKSFKPIYKLNLNSDKYQLINIDKFDTDKYLSVYKLITVLNVNDNYISTLNLKNYNSLNTLYASNNHITSVNLYLPSLKKLDLSKNNITKIFELINLPNLQILNLSQNSIKEVSYDNFKNIKTTLIELDLSENLIEFFEVKEFFYFTENMGAYMKELTSFNIEGNPFTIKKKYKDNYIKIIQSNFHKLRYLNSKDIISDVKNMDNNFKININNIKDKMIELEKRENLSVYKNINYNKKSDLINLKTINNELLKINQIGRINDKSLEELEDMVDSYLENLSNTVNMGQDPNEESELDDFEIFLDYIEKIIDSISGYEKRLYNIIGQFAIIKYGKFASRSLSCIKQRINNNNASDVVEVLASIHTFLKKTNPDLIPCSVIEGLQLFFDEGKLSKEMRTILKTITIIADKIKKNINYNAVIVPDKNNKNNKNKDAVYLDLFNSLISFVTKSLSIDNEEFYKEIIGNENFLNLCIENLKDILNINDNIIINNSSTLNILINILTIIKILALKCKKVSDKQEEIKRENLKLQEGQKKKKIINSYENFVKYIISSGIRDRIEQKLNLLLQKVLVNDDINEANEISTRLENKNKKLMSVSLMQAYGALLSNASDITKFLDSRSLTMKIISILGQNEIISPILTHGACDFTLYFLENNIIKEEPSKFSIINGKLYNFRNLLLYYFPENKEFLQACIIAEKYGERTLERNKPLPLLSLDSPILNDLFISITQLMSFFGRNSQNNSKIKNICKETCSEMNKLNRDNALSNILKIPNENVKLSVVRCFYFMNVEELEPEELSIIYKQLTFISSINGKNFTIVAIIYLIMNKWFLVYLKKGEFKKIEICKEAIYICLNILSKVDLKKSSTEEENNRKFNMCAVLCMFLINISCFEYTRNFFNDPKNCAHLIKILTEEQESANQLDIKFPIQIEKCHVGWNLNNLLNGIRDGSINPYNYISLRVLIHIGDVLLNQRFPIIELNFIREPEDVMIELIEILHNRNIEHFKDQEYNWREIEEREKKKHYNLSVGVNDNNLKNEQKNFVKNFSIFLDFVLGQCSEEQIAKYSRLWEYKFSNNIDSNKYSLYQPPRYFDDEGNLKVINEQNDSFDIENEENEEYFINKEKNGDIKLDNDSSEIYNKFKNFLREEEYDVSSSKDIYGVNFSYIQNELFHFKKITEPGFFRDKEEETPNNPYIRSLFIAAFLRCIYGVLEYPIDINIKNDLIKIIYQKDNIKILCQIAECTKFIDNHIATKLLIIMKHVLRHSKIYFDQFTEIEKIKKSNEINENFLNKMGYISYMIRKIIRYYKKILNIENENDNILLNEICLCCSHIINQLQILNFENEKVREMTITTMIDYEIVKTFIEMIKNYMNKNAEEEKSDKNSFKNRLLKEMIDINSSILGEYISRCPTKKYDVLESFTRSYIFDRCHMRKSFIKEIIENEKISNLKVIINGSLNNIYINFLSFCQLINFNKKKTDNNIVIGTDSGLEFITIDDKEDIFSMNFYNTDEKKKILVENISNIIIFQYLNRMIIQTRDNEYGFFFEKMKSSFSLVSALKNLNNHINVYENVPIFQINDIRYNPNREEEKNAPEIEDEYKVTMIYCLFEAENICCDFSFLFGNSEGKLNENVVVIRENQIQVYKELKKEWERRINSVELFQKVRNNNYDLINLEYCYKSIAEYDIGDFESIKLINADKVLLKYKGKLSGVIFQIFDDLSYVKFKEALKLNEEFDDFENI